MTPEQHLALLEQRARNLQPVMASIGQALVADAQLCFREQRDPWGTPWRPLQMKTLEARARRRTGGKLYRKGKRQYTAAGKAIVASGKALLDTGRLRNSITYQVEPEAVVVGTNVGYGGTHQFGRGPIPARPYLPVRAPGQPADLPPKLAATVDSRFRRYLDTGR